MEAARVRAQLSRILTSATFTDAGRASSFLRFIVEHALDGRPSEIKESVIAVEVLGRSPSFDSKTDPIVRVEAGRLRDRLREYYDRHGPADDVLISVPKGGYVPEFSERQPPAQPQIPNVLRLSLLPPESAAFDSFVISPDGRRIAFSADVNGRTMLWVRDLDSLDAKLLPGTETAAFPFWSPDSRSIGFFTPFKLKVIHAAGGPCRDIADVVLGRGGAWNRDGIIVFCPRPVGALYQIPAAGGTPQAVTSLDAARAEISHGFPQFLADGRRFLYFAASCRPGESSIRVGSLDSTTSKPLVGAETSAAYAPVFGGRSGLCCTSLTSHSWPSRSITRRWNSQASRRSWRRKSDIGDGVRPAFQSRATAFFCTAGARTISINSRGSTGKAWPSPPSVHGTALPRARITRSTCRRTSGVWPFIVTTIPTRPWHGSG